MNYATHPSAKRGFTLIELLVVVAIIGLLSSIVLVSLSTARGKARDATRVSTLTSLRTALELYATDHGGKYPTGGWYDSSMGATWLPGLSPTYIRELPHDPIEGQDCKLLSGQKYGYYYIADSTGSNYKLQVCSESSVPASSILWDAQRAGSVFMVCQAPTNAIYCGSGI